MCDGNLRSNSKLWGRPRGRKARGNMNVRGDRDTTLEGAGPRAERGTSRCPARSLRHDWEGLLKEWILCGQRRKRRGHSDGVASGHPCLEGTDSCWDGEIGLADFGCLSLQGRGPSFQEGKADLVIAYMSPAQRARAPVGYIEGTPQTGSRRLNHGKGLRPLDHHSPTSLDRLGNRVTVRAGGSAKVTQPVGGTQAPSTMEE